MLNFADVNIRELIVHNVGNKGLEEDLLLSEDSLKIEDEAVVDILSKYMLSPFKGDIFYNFHDPMNIENNEVYNYAQTIFDDPDTFTDQSVNIARHLFNKSLHPKIKSGELYIVYLEDCYIDDEVADAIGIFKSENKDTYIRIHHKGNNFEIQYEDGININKLDKGCLIFNTEKESGYKMCIVDSYSKSGEEAQYWKDEFLQVKQRKDDYYNTQSVIDVCANFSKEVLNKDNNIDRTEQVDFLKKTEEFFAKNEEFDQEEFVNTVLPQPQMQESFREYKKDYEEANEVETPENFNISDDAVKKGKKYFKSVIKLDKNFHLYVHGNPEFIDKGYDESRQLKYYKLFYDQEK